MNETRMSVIGPCPRCKAPDEIVQTYEDPSSRLECGACHKRWFACDFLQEARAKMPSGDWRIICVTVNGGFLSASCWNGEAIPFHQQIQRVLNSALITRFRLGVALCAEGGVEGRFSLRKGRQEYYVEFRNNQDPVDGNSIGLNDELGRPGCVGSQKVMRWAYEFLGILFCEYIGGDKNHIKGAALFLDENDPGAKNKLDFLLCRALDGKGGRGFAKKVAATMQKFSKIEERHITGVSDESIKEIFVAPPLS
jgi:hypothetical protein